MVKSPAVLIERIFSQTIKLNVLKVLVAALQSTTFVDQYLI